MAGSAPLASAIVPSYNYASTVIAAVESLLAQTFDDHEVVVVDNVSTDGSRELLRDRYANDPRVRLFLETEHLGMSANFNRGLQRARGKYSGLCAADDRWHPHHLATMVPVLQRSPGAALAYARADVVDAEGKPLPEEQSPFDLEPDDARFFDRLVRGGNGDNFVPCMSVVFDRELALARGGFQHQLMITQDYDLWLRLAIDHEVRHVDEVTVAITWHGQNTSAPSKLTAERVRSDTIHTFTRLLEQHRDALRRRGVERDATHRLAKALVRRGRDTPDDAESRACYRRAIALEPWRLGARLALLRSYLGGRRPR